MVICWRQRSLVIGMWTIDRAWPARSIRKPASTPVMPDTESFQAFEKAAITSGSQASCSTIGTNLNFGTWPSGAAGKAIWARRGAARSSKSRNLGIEPILSNQRRELLAEEALERAEQAALGRRRRV